MMSVMVVRLQGYAFFLISSIRFWEKYIQILWWCLLLLGYTGL